jgi:plasmid stabilization system protein ParE
VNFERIVKFIGDKWTDREVENFIQKAEQVLSGLRSHPKMFKVSKKKGIRKGLITSHTSFYYKIGRKEIKLITFQDNRENPSSITL